MNIFSLNKLIKCVVVQQLRERLVAASPLVEKYMNYGGPIAVMKAGCKLIGIGRKAALNSV